MERVVDAPAAHGGVTTMLVPSHPLQRSPPVER